MAITNSALIPAIKNNSRMLSLRIPAIEWEKSVSKTAHSPENAIALANKLRIHPAIVAGRVRYESDNWRLLNGLLAACRI